MKKKNIFNLILTGCLLAVMAFSMIDMTGCTTTTPLKDALGSTLTKTDIQTYGRTIGKAGYYVYSFYANNEKYAEEISRMKTIWNAIEKAKAEGGREGLDLAAINDATVKLITLAAAAELGPSNAVLVGEGARLALILGYNFYKSRIQEDNLEIYLNAVWEGVQEAKAEGADIIATHTEIDELIKMEPSEECSLQCLTDKIRSRLAAGGLTNYDKKRLKKRLEELEDEKKKIDIEVQKEIQALREAAEAAS